MKLRRHLVAVLVGLCAPAASPALTITRVPTPAPFCSDCGSVMPAWAPDNHTLAYVHWSLWGPQRFLVSDIYSYDIQAGQNRPIYGFFALPCYGCENIYRDPTWSPDMQWLAFTENARILVAAVDALLLGGLGGPVGEQAVWSPDGLQIAFVRPSSGIFVMSATGGTERFLVAGANPAWSPDSQWIAFDADRNGRRHLGRIAASGGEPEWLPHGAGDAHHPTWSPSGELLAYSSIRDIMVMRIDTGQLSHVTNDPPFDTEPVWSPDGQRIAFVSDRSGKEDIYIATDLDNVNVESSSWSEIKILYR